MRIKENLPSGITILGGIITLLTTFYYMKSFIYSLGFYYGAGTIVNAYNITLSQQLLSSIPSQSALSLAIYITYLMAPVSLIIFMFGVIWFMGRRNDKTLSAVVMILAVFYLAMIIVLETNFNSGGHLIEYSLAYIGSGLAIIGAGTTFIPQKQQAKPARATPISIDPEKPYTNISILSNRLIGKMSGEIRIIDMHFDVRGLDNLIRILGDRELQFQSIKVLAKGERLSDDFAREFNDFKSELAGKGVAFELRVMSDATASQQHERLMMDSSIAYKIPPLNIINRKSEHIVGVNHAEASHRFNKLWSEAVKFENTTN
jgi:hypothetical protein